MSSIVVCSACGKTSPENRTVCQHCGTTFRIKWSFRYLTDGLSLWLKAIGIIYFTLSFGGGLVLLIKTKEEMGIIIGISILFTSTMVLTICVALARMIEQNVYIIRHLRDE